MTKEKTEMVLILLCISIIIMTCKQVKFSLAHVLKFKKKNANTSMQTQKETSPDVCKFLKFSSVKFKAMMMPFEELLMKQVENRCSKCCWKWIWPLHD